MKRVSVGGFVLLCAISVAGCGGSRQPAVHQTAVMSNSELQGRVRAKLDSDPEIQKSHLFVDTRADQKTIVVSGSVPSQDLHQVAINLAQTSVPGITVVDQIEVQPRELARTEESPATTSHPKQQGRKSRTR